MYIKIQSKLSEKWTRNKYMNIHVYLNDVEICDFFQMLIHVHVYLILMSIFQMPAVYQTCK